MLKVVKWYKFRNVQGFKWLDRQSLNNHEHWDWVKKLLLLMKKLWCQRTTKKCWSNLVICHCLDLQHSHVCPILNLGEAICVTTCCMTSVPVIMFDRPHKKITVVDDFLYSTVSCTCCGDDSKALRHFLPLFLSQCRLLHFLHSTMRILYPHNCSKAQVQTSMQCK